MNDYSTKIMNSLYSRLNKAKDSGMKANHLMNEGVSFTLANAALANELSNPTISTLDKINNAIVGFGV